MDALKPRERLLGPALRTQPDRRLVALARDGSAPAQEEIVRRYRAALVRYAGSIVGAGAAEDVVQEALTKGLAALPRADEELRLRPWLYAIVRNTALNHLRDAGPATEQLDENYDGVEQPPQALERREQMRSLVGGLRRLPRQQREALVGRELEGRSHEEIGAELGVSSGAARQLIFRAREALRVGFGSLLPMPLLRSLADSGGDAAVGVATGAGGGALAAKAAVAVFAAGAAVTAGVAIDHGARQRPEVAPPAAEVAVRPAVVAPAGAGAAAPTVVVTGFDQSRRDGSSGSSGHGGDDGSGPGSAEEQAGEHGGGSGGGGPGPSAHSGPGSSDGGELSDDSGGHGDRSGSGSGGEDLSGSSQSGPGGGGGDRGSSGHGGRGSESGTGSSSGGSGSSSLTGSSGSGHDGGTSGGSGSGGSGSGSSGSGSSSGGSSGSGSGGSGGSDDTVEAIPTAPAPSPSPEPALEESSSGSGPGSGESTSSGDSRDLSGGAVSQGSDDPD